MTSSLKRLISSLLLLGIWVVPTTRGFAASSPELVTETTPARQAPADVQDASTFAELFPFGGLIETAGLIEQTSDGTLASYEAREAQEPGLQDFRGGAVYVYLGSTALLVLVVVLLVLLL